MLHPNPDKFNGTATMQARGIWVVTLRQVAELILWIHKIRLDSFFDDFKPDYPKDAARPDVFGDRTTVLEAGGMRVTAHVLGALGASAAHIVVRADDAVFVGDLVASRGHAWLELGETDARRARIAEVRAFRPNRVFVGRGAAGDASLLDAQAA